MEKIKTYIITIIVIFVAGFLVGGGAVYLYASHRLQRAEGVSRVATENLHSAERNVEAAENRSESAQSQIRAVRSELGDSREQLGRIESTAGDSEGQLDEIIRCNHGIAEIIENVGNEK